MALTLTEINSINTTILALQDDPSIAHTTAQMAKLAGISPLRFKQAFKEHTGIPVQQFITEAKMKKAAHWLLQDKAIKEISALLGYSDLTSFYRSFSKYYNCTPSQYRQKNI
jgi:AraC-like DNA-binding protein